MTMKHCSKCVKDKPLDEFRKNSRAKDGLMYSCRQCQNEYKNKYREVHKDETNKQDRTRYYKNQEYQSKRSLMYYHENREDRIEYMRSYYHKDNKLAIARTRLSSKRFKEKHGISYDAHLRSKNHFYRSKVRLRIRLNKALKQTNWKKTSRFTEYIGCSKEEFIKHIESLFQPGMTWKNYGLKGWHFDHHIPLSSAKTINGLYKLCHYTNIRPLWAEDNLKKGDTVPTA